MPKKILNADCLEEIRRFEAFLIWFRQYKKMPSLNSSSKEEKMFHNWVQKMIWARSEKEDGLWFREYDNFIVDNELQTVFYHNYFHEAVEAVKKMKHKPDNIQLPILKSIKVKTLAILKTKLTK